MAFVQNQQQQLLTGQNLKQDVNMLRSNELGTGFQGGNVIEKDIRIVEEKIISQGSPRLQGQPVLLQGSPRVVQGSPRILQGSPTGLVQGSPMRQGYANQSLGNMVGTQGLQQNQGLNSNAHITNINTFSQGTNYLDQNFQGQNLQGQNFQGGLQGQNFQGGLQGQNFQGQSFQGQSFQGQSFQGQTMTNQCFTNQTQMINTGSIVEKIYEKPIIVTHQEQAIVKNLYEGRQVLRSDEVDVTQSHVLQPIVKEIHQDVIHEHHKDIIVEHKKDVIHEHHQNIIHEHKQPVIIEKHIHEHHQPIIHEKHTTLVEEKHIPFVHETHLQAANTETRQEIVHEVFEKPVVQETFSAPIVNTVQVDTIMETTGTNLAAGSSSYGYTQTQGLNQGYRQGFTQGQTFSQGQAFGGAGQTVIEETIITDKYYNDTGARLGDNQTYVTEVDEFGRPRKAGFFQNLKTKMGGKKNKEPKII